MRHLRRLGHCLSAAILAGAAYAPLHFLLWPELHLSASRALFALLAWASWGALWLGLGAFVVVEVVGLTARTLATHSGLSLPLWRWLTAAMWLLTTGVVIYNYRKTKELLLPEWRDALQGAGVIAGILFLLALLAGPASRWLARRPAALVLPPVIAVAAVWACWLAVPKPPAPGPVNPPPHASTPALLLVVSWEGADLPWLLPAIERGDMPFLKSRRDGAAWGQIRTVRPFSRFAAITSLVTGCSPALHGVLDRRAYRIPWLADAPVPLLLDGPWPAGQSLPWRAWDRTATLAPRRAPLWEILKRSGLKVGAVGWPGVVHATWAVPPPLAAEAMPFNALDPELRAAIEASIARKPEAADATKAAFAVAAETAAAAALRSAGRPVDALMVNSDLLARLRPLWGGGESEASQAEVLRQAARLLDDQLHALWSLMGGDNVLLVVVSPYGLEGPGPWRRLLGVVGGRRHWVLSPLDSPDGFVLLSGPGVRAGTRVRGAKLADVTETVLYLANLPVARDMSGRVLLEAVTDERAANTPLRLVPSYPADHGGG